MQLLGSTEHSANIRLSTHELILISNALNEVCNGVAIEEFEFHTRLGTNRGEALQLLDRLLEALDTIS